MFALYLLQSALVRVNTLLLQRVLDEPSWAARLGVDDQRGLTPLCSGRTSTPTAVQPRHEHPP